MLTFFSPSGYEVRKNSTAADVIVYLPLDTKNNAKEFLKLVHPEMAFFIKYEFWPNYLNELKRKIFLRIYSQEFLGKTKFSLNGMVVFTEKP